MYILGVLIGLILLGTISFMIVAAVVYLICWVLAIKFVLRYVIAAWLICVLIKWIWDTK